MRFTYYFVALLAAAAAGVVRAEGLSQDGELLATEQAAYETGETVAVAASFPHRGPIYYYDNGLGALPRCLVLESFTNDGTWRPVSADTVLPNVPDDALLLRSAEPWSYRWDQINDEGIRYAPGTYRFALVYYSALLEAETRLAEVKAELLDQKSLTVIRTAPFELLP